MRLDLHLEDGSRVAARTTGSIMERTPLAVTTLSSREFNQDTSRAKKAAQRGPVFITDRGRPAHVLLSIEEYQKLAGRSKTLAEALHMPGAVDVEFSPPKTDWSPTPAEFD